MDKSMTISAQSREGNCHYINLARVIACRFWTWGKSINALGVDDSINALDRRQLPQCVVTRILLFHVCPGSAPSQPHRLRPGAQLQRRLAWLPPLHGVHGR